MLLYDHPTGGMIEAADHLISPVLFNYGWNSVENRRKVLTVNTRKLLLVAAGAAVVICAVVLTLIVYGVRGVLNFHGIDLMYVFWPSSIMLLTSWRSTPLGITVTAASVLLNCLTYIAVALAGRILIRSSVRVLR